MPFASQPGDYRSRRWANHNKTCVKNTLSCKLDNYNEMLHVVNDVNRTPSRKRCHFVDISCGVLLSRLTGTTFMARKGFIVQREKLKERPSAPRTRTIWAQATFFTTEPSEVWAHACSIVTVEQNVFVNEMSF